MHTRRVAAPVGRGYFGFMAIDIRPPRPGELRELSALCLRSKAHWGYDQDFLTACRDELMLTPADLAATRIAVAELRGHIAGVAQIGRIGDDAEILKLFVDPPSIGRGVGRVLFDWCTAEARRIQAGALRIEADPDARPFYERMGARMIGTVPSGSISGRDLPLLALTLR